MADLSKRVQTVILHSHAHGKDHGHGHGKDHHGNQLSPQKIHHEAPHFESYGEFTAEQQADIDEGKNIIPVEFNRNSKSCNTMLNNSLHP